MTAWIRSGSTPWRVAAYRTRSSTAVGVFVRAVAWRRYSPKPGREVAAALSGADAVGPSNCVKLARMDATRCTMLGRRLFT